MGSVHVEEEGRDEEMPTTSMTEPPVLLPGFFFLVISQIIRT